MTVVTQCEKCGRNYSYAANRSSSCPWCEEDNNPPPAAAPKQERPRTTLERIEALEKRVTALEIVNANSAMRPAYNPFEPQMDA